MAQDALLNSIGQIHLSVEDFDRAVDFYRNTLEMTFLFDVPGQSMAFFDCGGVRLYLGKAENETFKSSPLIYFRVADIHDAHATLTERGVHFEVKPHVVHRAETVDLWLAAFRDTENHLLHLMCEQPRE